MYILVTKWLVNNMLRAIKIIIPAKEPLQDDNLKLFKKVNWLTSAERYKFYSLSFLYKATIRTSTLNSCFSEFYIKTPESETSRNGLNLILHRMSTEYGKSASFYQSIKMWNCLPPEKKRIQSSVVFDHSDGVFVKMQRKII
jgi:hypothetical protein